MQTVNSSKSSQMPGNFDITLPPLGLGDRELSLPPVAALQPLLVTVPLPLRIVIRGFSILRYGRRQDAAVHLHARPQRPRINCRSPPHTCGEVTAVKQMAKKSGASPQFNTSKRIHKNVPLPLGTFNTSYEDRSSSLNPENRTPLPDLHKEDHRHAIRDDVDINDN
ncbi:hypothetical protein EYF80_010370 [Liparis tanakae]|uniref:Uncharacterized protein n=1 Tax=Liparis tanakae TaxID=230148 RepID=A0A4Z2INA2_9TELE|nr:hypothetical protein EYF80_010370 [Liparis tanakae]